VAKPQESNLHPRLPERAPPAQEVSRSPTDISQVPSLSERFDDTRSRPSSSSESSPSSDLFEKSLKTSSPTFDSSHPLSVLCRSPLRPTLFLSLRTPTCAPSTPSVSLSSPRTSSLLEGSEASDLRRWDDDDFFHDGLQTGETVLMGDF